MRRPHPPRIDVLRQAFDDGRAAGRRSTGAEPDCPYPETDAQQRMVWLNGFRVGELDVGVANGGTPPDATAADPH